MILVEAFYSPEDETYVIREEVEKVATSSATFGDYAIENGGQLSCAIVEVLNDVYLNGDIVLISADDTEYECVAEEPYLDDGEYVMKFFIDGEEEQVTQLLQDASPWTLKITGRIVDITFNRTFVQ